MIEITTTQNRILFNLMHEPQAQVTEKFVGPAHNQTMLTVAKVIPKSPLWSYIQTKGWLTGSVKLHHTGNNYDDSYEIHCVLGKWTITHVAVG